MILLPNKTETRETLEERSFPTDFAPLFPILLLERLIVVKDVLLESISTSKESPILQCARLR